MDIGRNIIGRVFNIQKFSIHDGPGIRTVVFLKGCPLNCWWCSNPEGKKEKCSLVFYSDRCCYCGKCMQSCPHHVHKIKNHLPNPDHIIHRHYCTYCGQCITNCPNQALQIIGSDRSVLEILEDILMDNVFYEHSGGGVTLSGGEPTAQPQFTHALLKACKANNINTALETSGLFNWKIFKKNLALLDYILIDLKSLNNLNHNKYTGVTNDVILSNIKKLLLQNEQSNATLIYVPVIIRVPIIPGVNATLEDINAIAKFIVTNNPRNILKYIDVLPYHEYGKHKYQNLGEEYLMDRLDQSSNVSVIQAKNIFDFHGLNCKINEPFNKSEK